MAIEIKRTGKCDGCAYCQIDTNVIYNNDKPEMQFLRCANKDICDYLEKKFRKGLYEKCMWDGENWVPVK